MNDEICIRKRTFIAFFLIISIFSLLFIKSNAVEWPATADIPNVLAKIYPDSLTKDFYVQSAQNAPMKYLYSILYYLSFLFGKNIYYTMIALGLFVVVFLTSSIFSLLLITNYKKAIQSDDYKSNIILLLASCLIYFAILIYVNVKNPEIMGWPSIFHSPHGYVVATALSIIAYFIYETKYTLISLILAFISVFIHPLVAIYTLAFCLIVSSEMNNIPLFFKKYSPLFLSYAVPLLIIAVTVFGGQKITNKEYIDIFINFRHPHHFLLSKDFQVCNYIIWLSILACSCLILRIFKSKLFLNAILALVIFIIIPVIHFLGTEKLYIKIIAMLQLPRFWSFFYYIIIFFSVAAFFHVSNWFFDCFSYKNRLIRIYIYDIFYILFNRIHIKKILFLSNKILFICLIVFSALYIARQYYSFNRLLNNFKSDYSIVLNNISDKDILLPLSGKGFDILYLGKKNIFITDAFPFSEINFPAFMKRMAFLRTCKASFSNECADRIYNEYDIDYILADSAFQYDDQRFSVIDTSEKFKLLRVNR